MGNPESSDFNDIEEREWLAVDIESALTDIAHAEEVVPGQKGFARNVKAALGHVVEFTGLSRRGEYTDPSVEAPARELEEAAREFMTNIPRGENRDVLIPLDRVRELLLAFAPRLRSIANGLIE